MIDYPPRHSRGAEIQPQPEPELMGQIENVNWPSSSKEHQRAVRWFLARPEEKAVMREVGIVMMIYHDALRIRLKADSAAAAARELTSMRG